MGSRPGCRIDRHLICNSGTLRAKSGNFGSIKIQGEVLGRVWSSVGFQLLFFDKQSILADHPCLRGKRSSVTYCVKDSAGNILTDENEIFSRWREYFEDLSNSVKASTRETHEVTHLREEEFFTAVEVATAIEQTKSEKAAGGNEIRPEMLKAMTEKGIFW